MTREDKMNEIRQAISLAKYNSFSQEGRVSSLARLMTGYSQRKGQAISDEASMRIAGTLDADISRFYGRELTFQEVVLAIDWGMHRVFGEFSGMNADRIFDFVRLYRECAERADVQAEMKSQSAMIAPAGKRDNGRRNWDAMAARVLGFLDEYRASGRLTATDTRKTEDGWTGYLIATQRAIAARCYRFLRSCGMVSRDAATMDAEREAYGRASSKAGEWVTQDLADAMMLERYMGLVLSSGYSIPDNLALIPDEERNFYD